MEIPIGCVPRRREPGNMSASDESDQIFPSRRIQRLARTRLPMAAAFVFVGLWALGALTALPALAGFVLIAAAALLDQGMRTPAPAVTRQDERTVSRTGDAWLEEILGGLPDPVIALNRGEEVVALNSQASALAPALRRNEPISLGLRV